jgi:hypothetical protein
MDQLQYLVDLIEKERDNNSEFRDEMRVKVHSLEQRFAIQDALKAERSRRMKIIGGVVGTLITLLSVIVPFMVK